MTETVTNIPESTEPFGVLLAALYSSASETEETERSLAELRLLTETSLGDDAEACTFYTMTQCRPSPEAATYIGAGKVEEAGELCRAHNIALVVFDCELSPSQIRNMEDILDSGDTWKKAWKRTDTLRASSTAPC